MALITCTKQLTCHIVTGELSFDELAEVLKDFYEGEPTDDVLWDFREATAADITEKQVTSIVDYLKVQIKTRKKGRSAIVVPKDVDFGLARMFQSYGDAFPFKVEVFRKMEEAIKWLGQTG